MKSRDSVLRMIIQVVAVAMGIVFMTALCEVPAGSSAAIVLMVLVLSQMFVFTKESYDELR